MWNRKLSAFAPLRTAAYALMLLLAMSCGRSYLYDDIHSLAGENWKIEQKERFNFELMDTAATYRIFFHVRNSTNYRYSNLYLFMTTQFPNGNIARDTLECVLALPDGQWTGKGFGRLKENLILLNPGLKFPIPGQYIVDLQQAMREDPLNGISDIGLRIEANRQ